MGSTLEVERARFFLARALKVEPESDQKFPVNISHKIGPIRAFEPGSAELLKNRPGPARALVVFSASQKLGSFHLYSTHAKSENCGLSQFVF